MFDGDTERNVQSELERLKISSDGAIISSMNNETSYPSYSTTSPWKIDLIIENMMSHLDYDSLRSCFSVCRFWRKKAFAESKSRTYLRKIGPDIKDLDELYAELSRKPAKSIKLVTLMIYELPLHPPLLHQSFKLLSSYLNYLIITLRQKPQDLFHALKQLPNLSELQILPFLPPKWEGCKLNYPLIDPISLEPYVFGNIRYLEFLSIFSEPYNQPQESCLSDICKTFPNLVALSIYNLVPEDHVKFNNISFAKLKHLKICDYTISVNNYLKMLAKLDLKLCRLQFRFNPPRQDKSVDVDLFRKFVESQKDSLQAFDMAQQSSTNTAVPCHDQAFCPFPLDLPHLKTLHIQKPFIRNLTPIFNALPSLVEAEISVPTGYNWKGVLPKKVTVFPNLQVLRVDHMEPVIFGDMSDYFPSLKLLQINKCTNPDKGIFNEPNYSKNDPEAVLSEPTVSVCKCDKGCGCGHDMYNINMQLKAGRNDYDFVRVTRNSEISKAQHHWKEIEILIAGNCNHSTPGICFIYNDKNEIKRSLKNSNMEQLGFQGKLQWTRWNAKCFSSASHIMKPYNGMIWCPLTLDSVFVPFEDYTKQTIPEHMISMQSTPETCFKL